MLREVKDHQCIKRMILPGGEIVLSNTEGIVISMIGLRDGMPFLASWQAESISSILQGIEKQQGMVSFVNINSLVFLSIKRKKKREK